MAGMKGDITMRDQVQEEANALDAWAKSEKRGGNVDGQKHAQYIDAVSRAIQTGQISEEGAMNLAKRVKGLAPFILPSIESRKSMQNIGEIANKYISPGTGGSGDYSEPPTDPREDPKGLVRELASNPAYLPIAKEYSSLYGIDKENAAQGRGSYRIPIQTGQGIYSFNARSEKPEEAGYYVTDAQGRPVIGTVSDPALQGRLEGSKAHAGIVGKELATAGNLVDSGSSVKNAMAMLDKGIYTGTYAETSKMLAKGIPGMDKEKAANTEQFVAYIGNVVIPMMKDLGGSDTVEELNYMKQLVAGNISLEPAAIKNILSTTERKIIAKQRRMKAQAGTIGLGGKAEAVLPESVQPAPAPQGGILTDQQREALRKRHGL